MSLQHFLFRAKDSGHWKGETISEEQVMQLLREKIESVSFDRIKEDIVRFIPDATVLNMWGKQYFTDLTGKLKFAQK